MSTYDVHVQPLPVAQQSVIKGLYTYGFRKTMSVRGIQRLVNRWALEFLTEQGSDPLDPDRGTAFMSLVGSNVSATRDLEEICRIAVSKANRRMALYEAQYPPESTEDAFASATITELTVSPGDFGITLRVRIRNQEGTAATISVP